jgi:hypothetical protein
MFNRAKLCWILKASRWNVIFVCGYGVWKKLVLKKVTAEGKLGTKKLIVYQQWEANWPLEWLT